MNFNPVFSFILKFYQINTICKDIDFNKDFFLPFLYIHTIRYLFY
jgi:hypothetical protein